MPMLRSNYIHFQLCFLITLKVPFLNENGIPFYQWQDSLKVNSTCSYHITPKTQYEPTFKTKVFKGIKTTWLQKFSKYPVRLF